MYKTVGIWTLDDPVQLDAFERHYHDVHLVLASRLPGLLRIVATCMDSDLDGNPPAFHRAAELHFPDAATMLASAHSPEWAAMRADRALMIERFSARAVSALGAPVEIDPAVA